MFCIFHVSIVIFLQSCLLLQHLSEMISARKEKTDSFISVLLFDDSWGQKSHQKQGFWWIADYPSCLSSGNCQHLPGSINALVASKAIFYIQDLKTLKMWKEDSIKMAFEKQILCLTNVFSSSLCEAGAITGNTLKPFCAPQMGACFREALYTATCTTYNTETIKVSNKDATISLTSLAQGCDQMEKRNTTGSWSLSFWSYWSSAKLPSNVSIQKSSPTLTWM